MTTYQVGQKNRNRLRLRFFVAQFPTSVIRGRFTTLTKAFWPWKHTRKCTAYYKLKSISSSW